MAHINIFPTFIAFWHVLKSSDGKPTIIRLILSFVCFLVSLFCFFEISTIPIYTDEYKINSLCSSSSRTLDISCIIGSEVKPEALMSDSMFIKTKFRFISTSPDWFEIDSLDQKMQQEFGGLEEAIKEDTRTITSITHIERKGNRRFQLIGYEGIKWYDSLGNHTDKEYAAAAAYWTRLNETLHIGLGSFGRETCIVLPGGNTLTTMKLLFLDHDISQQYYEMKISEITNEIDTLKIHARGGGTISNFTYIGNNACKQDGSAYDFVISDFETSESIYRFYYTVPPLQNLQLIRTYILGTILTAFATWFLKLLKDLFVLTRKRMKK